MALVMALSLPAIAMAAGQVGEPAADFSLPAAQGGTYTFSDHDGQVRFLFFFGYG
jgi:peroxiredoxin